MIGHDWFVRRYLIEYLSLCSCNHFVEHRRLRQNFELLKHKKQEANGILMTLEREVANKMEETRSLNRYMNNIKPEIMKLQRSKQQYYL